MGLSKRNYLSGTILLSESETGGEIEKYTVKSVIGEGDSIICYEAVHELEDGSVEIGILKEFYPLDIVIDSQSWYYSLERLENGQLNPGKGIIQKFHEMCQDYINNYRGLKKFIESNPLNEILKKFIWQGELLYGYKECESDNETTVYTWFSGIVGKQFNEYLQEVRQNPEYRPEERLGDILAVIDALSDYINALHIAGLSHMDIRPSNFLVQYDSNFKINTNNISLFDINNVCSMESRLSGISETEGYQAPEAMNGKVDNRSDIYSIGAMLFHAVVVTKDIPDGLYRNFYYPCISQLVKESRLFTASETNSDAVLMSRICKILEKCLAKDSRKRYQSCLELKKDIEKAKQRLDKLLSIEIKKDMEGMTDPTIAIQKLLYEHPLYEMLEDGMSEMNVLVIGLGGYGKKFIDICLQTGQMYGINLNITAVSSELEEDRENYLSLRPAITDFVNVDGSMDSEGDRAYATLQFKSISQLVEDRMEKQFSRSISVNREIIESIIQKAVYKEEKYHYIFVALGEDAINKTIAGLCSKELQKKYGYMCPVCYVCQKEVLQRKIDLKNKLIAVCVNEIITTESIDQNLEQMAFNTHLSWMDSLNIDVNKERKKFFTSVAERDRYNRVSSMAFALSIKYKLHSIQIDSLDPLKAAEQFSKKILDRKAIDIEARNNFDRLVNLEHRRWVLEKVTDGWKAPRDDRGNLLLKECIIRGSVKDSVNRTHPCLVHSSDTSPLNDQQYFTNEHKKWNEGAIDSTLDELDKMSIELHRCFRKQAERIKNENMFLNGDIVYIQNLIPIGCDKVQRAFKQYQFALKNIVNGVESYSRQYDYYEDVLKAEIEELSPEIKVKIIERLAVIKHAFFPVIESNLYRNYKAYDEVLINRIPFILTYRYLSSLAVAFEDGKFQNGRNEAVFGNVASATMLSPEKIVFLYCFNRDSDINWLVRKVDAVINYFGKRKVHSAVKLVISCLSDVIAENRERLQKELKKLEKRYGEISGNIQMEASEIMNACNYSEAMKQFKEYLRINPVELYDGGNALFPSSYDNALFIQQILGLKIPYFEFDWRNKVFSKQIGCEYLKFVEDNSFLRIQDMFALMNAEDNSFNLPEFADDYEALWKIYTGEYLSNKKFEYGVKNWNHLCISLMKYEDKRKPLVKIAVGTKLSNILKTITYFLPLYTFSTVKYILQKLKEYGIVRNESNLVNHTSDTCKLELVICEEYEKFLDKVFSNPQILLEYYGMNVNKYKLHNKDYVEIRYYDMNVINLNLDEDGNGKNEFLLRVLQELEKNRFITQLEQNVENPKLVSFIYSSPRIKQLLTSAGAILEIYAYYEVLKTGYFDDIASSYEFRWESGGVKNELDLVLTKGFRSIIIECKAVAELKLDFYHKLHSIAEQFGIGTIKILLGNTYANSNIVAKDLNVMQRSRGAQLNIRTISSEQEIVNIGQTLIQVMEEINGNSKISNKI